MFDERKTHQGHRNDLKLSKVMINKKIYENESQVLLFHMLQEKSKKTTNEIGLGKKIMAPLEKMENTDQQQCTKYKADPQVTTEPLVMV